ncbi:hypothetical protein OS493_029791 [Desmophyllum pertusum]|uniref:Uncharacterized protein n=1 Tax=Desmophyllum pertusum TaxID=174260 RepID=A0A9W9YWK4_9CNID|nr:hypothetical protein OS493_029791 [Desmophyllum pertusum]
MTSANSMQPVDVTAEARGGNEQAKGVNVAAVVVPVVLCILVAALLLAGFFYLKRATNESLQGVENVCDDDRDVLLCQDA